MHRRYPFFLLLLLAVVPALLGSFFIMQLAQAGRLLVLQQMFVALVSAGICAFAIWRARRSAGNVLSPPILLAVAVLALALPLMFAFVAGTDADPVRWLNLGGFRIYAAALVLPAAIFLLVNLMRHNGRQFRTLLVLSATALLLAAQPDAAQVSAFAIACALPIFRASLRLPQKILSLLLLALCVYLAWMQPDPLAPVPYVEGVLEVAQAAGALALVFAVLALALPVAALAWQAKMLALPALGAVAIYYLAIAVFAYAQLTPMPLLGFGASPIMGYFVLIFLVAREQRVPTPAVTA